jgi:hypothetical protein
MKIHHSSLAFTPLSINQKVSRNNSEQNKAQNRPSIATGAQDKKPNQPSSPEEIKQKLDNANLVDFTDKNFIKPTDSRTLRALSAYNQEFNAPLQDQRAQLITGIDTYA